mmetsp:Transcript_5778/g.5972  ORF Transcript_5778/g.5972 Transcript_5778/m.5972 type:complete len:369 (-) Transcript_5778:56-1162(-)
MMNDIKIAHWKQKWSLPTSPLWTLTGFSRAAYRTGFYIPELDIMLDAGPQNFNHPSHIFITHTHGDHIASLPFTLIGDENGNRFLQLYAPKQAEIYLRKYISCLFEVNSLQAEYEEICKEWYQYNGYDTYSIFRTIINKSQFEIEVILCDHSIPTISYGFSLIKQKLKPEYSGLSTKEIGKLRKSGVEITHEVIEKKFTFICDTSIAVMTTYPQILSYPIIIIECTFLYPEEIPNAIQTKHIHWNDIEPYIINNPNTIFVLIHFSLRYKEEEIIEFFRETKRKARNENKGGEKVYENIKVWAGDTTKCWWEEDYIVDPKIDTDLDNEIGNIDRLSGSGGCSCSLNTTQNHEHQSNISSSELLSTDHQI